MKIKLKKFLWFFFLIMYLEIMYRIFILKTFIDVDLLLVMLFSIPIALLFHLLCGLFKEKINKICTIILSGLITFWFLVQTVYYNFYQAILSVFSLTNGAGQVMQFAKDIVKVTLGIWYVILIMALPFILFLIFGKKIISFKKMKFKKTLLTLIFTVIFYGITFLAIFINKTGEYSLNTLVYDTHAPMIMTKRMGILTMTRYDIQRFLFGFDENSVVDPSGKEVIIEEEIKYNMLDIDFDYLIENESNNTIKSMHEYFKGVEPVKQNKYTGIFKDKNLIFITAEGFDTLAVDEKLTPTLYKMANSGFVFKNFYQPLYPVSTSDGEYMNMTSLIPKEGVWSAYRSSKIYMPFGIGNMFKKLGYKTNGYHNNGYKYYDRNLSHPNMGFTWMGCGNGMEKRINCNIWPESDYDMVKATLNDYLYRIPTETGDETSSLVEEVKTNTENQKFATYYMTVSGHLNYSRMGNSMSNKHWKEVQDLPYSDAVKAYYGCQIELENAMNLLLTELESAGILDDTVIVLAPDHYPYGLKNERGEMGKILGFDKTDKFENYRTTLIIYNSTIKRTEIDKYCGSIDILPTVYNLFGLEYDSRLLMGRDILDNESEGMVILSDRSWISSKGRYNSINGKFEATKVKVDEKVVNEDGTTSIVTKEKDVEIPEGYVEEMTSIANARFKMSNLILSNDYYKKVELDHLGKRKIETEEESSNEESSQE